MDAFRRLFKPDEYRDEQSEAKGRPAARPHNDGLTRSDNLSTLGPAGELRIVHRAPILERCRPDGWTIIREDLA